jgi:hypothetical protein
MALVPDQSPKASQVFAVLDDQVRLVVSFKPTLVGLAASATVGAAGGGVLPTVTVTASVVRPPSPLQVKI